MTNKKPIDKKYLITSLKDFDEKILSKKYITDNSSIDGDSLKNIATTEFVVKAVANALSSVTNLRFETVDILPETGESMVIYLVPKSGKQMDNFDEFYWTGEDFECMGSTSWN